MKKSVLALSMLSLSSVYAMNGLVVGGDLGLNHIAYKDNHGNLVLDKRTSPNLNLFASKEVHKLFGLEFGLQGSFKKEDNRVEANSSEFGRSNYTLSLPHDYKTKVAIYGANLNVLGKYKFNNKLVLRPILGLAVLRHDVKVALDKSDDQNPQPDEIGRFNINQSKTAVVPRVGLALNYNVEWCYGFRAKVVYEGTSRLGFDSVEPIANTLRAVKPKNNVTVSLGVYYSLAW